MVSSQIEQNFLDSRAGFGLGMLEMSDMDKEFCTTYSTLDKFMHGGL
jgi:hypothetical protein